MISLHRLRAAASAAILASAVCMVSALAVPAASSPMPQTPAAPHSPIDPEAASDRSLVSPSDEVIDALLLGDTEAALRALDALGLSAPQHADAWTVYRGEAWKQKGDLQAAKGELDGFEARFPESPWVAKARFERAEIARALGQQADAEVILREEATALRSAERRIELGGELVQAAEALGVRAESAPTDEARGQLRQKARLLLEEAHRLKTSPEFQRRTALAMARLVLAQGDWQATVEWTTAVGELEEPKSPLAFEAEIVAARAKLALGRAAEARDSLMNSGASGVLRGYALAFLGEAWHVEGQSLFAIDAWERLLVEQPQHPAALRYAMRMAEVYGEIGRTDEALAAWRRVQDFGGSDPADGSPAEETADELVFLEPLLRMIERHTNEPRLDAPAIGRRALFRRASLQASVGRHAEAIASFESYVASHPGAEDWNAAQEGLVSASFGRASSWLDVSADANPEDLGAAENALLAFADAHPLDHRASDALFQWATLRETYANRFMALEPSDARRPFYGATVERLEDLARRTANSDPELSGRSLFHAAELVQNRLEDPRRAIALYQRVVGSSRGSALLRLREMQETLLVVGTSGLVRPGEPLVVDVDARNIEEVSVQAVRLDLGQYFQRHGTTEGIERLDLDLIAPDVEATVPIEGYAAYANLSRKIRVPVGGDDREPGVYAVTVVAAGKRATTLVLRSELDLIVKRSKAEVFVLVTETDRDGNSRVAPGVEVTVSYESDGKRETAMITTDADGVASLRAPEGNPFGADTRVFAARGGHVAATRLTGEQRGTAVVLQPRADLQLDRTAYRPGDEIRFRAVLRGVQDGAWQMPALTPSQVAAGQRFTTELIAPTGVAIARLHFEETSIYGTLSGRFELDAAAPSGTWTIRTTSPVGASAVRQFTVGEIEVPRVSLALTSAQTVVLRGEMLEIVATAETAWGAPLSGASVVWTDPRGIETRSETDSNGRTTLPYSTEQAVSGETLGFRAQLPEDEGISASIAIQVAVSALSVRVHVEQDVVLAGETFNATLGAVAPDGKTEPTEVRLVGTRRYPTRPGRFAEERFLDTTVTTDAKGEANVAVSAEAGGHVTLVATARDRFGREVSHQCSLEVAGADDVEPLRVLATDTSLRAGDRGVVRVVDRSESGGLALMTITGSKVLEYRVLSLASGVNELAFAADATHVPDVQVSIAAIRGRAFHERSATFRVTRPLEITVEAPRSVAPEGAAEIVVRATDGLGNPVQAELSVALVDRALLAAYPDRSSSLEDVFGIRGSRTPAFVSAASSTFRYSAITKEIDAAILEEGRRAEAAAALDDMRLNVGQALEEAEDAPMAAFDVEGLEFAPSPAPSMRKRMSSAAQGAGGGAGGRHGGRFGAAMAGGAVAPEVGLENPTAYWNATILTDVHGVARITIPMPRLEASWRLRVAGVTVDHRFGTHESAIVTRSPMVAVLDAPPYLREGDEPQLRGVLTLETPLEADATVDFELIVTGPVGAPDSSGAIEAPRASVQRGKSVLRAGESRLAYTFEKLAPVSAGGGLKLEFSAAIAGGPEGAARDIRGCAVRPAGYLLRDTAAGRLTSETAVDLELNGAAPVELTLVAGATEAQWLVDTALGRGMGWRAVPGDASPMNRIRGQGALAIASQLYGAALLLEAAGRTGGLAPATIAALGARCDGLVGALVSRVGADGGWSRDAGCWRGRAEETSDSQTTARAILALAAARRAGRVIPKTIWGGGLAIAETKLSAASNDEERALLCWALESGGKGNDLVLNRLHRERARLDGNTGAVLTLALVAANKKAMAAEVAASLAAPGSGGGSRMAAASRLDRTALFVLARASAGALTEADAELLRAQLPWIDPVGLGTAVAAEVSAGALASASDRPVTFEVAVAGGKPQVIQIRPADGDGGTREVSLLLPEGAKGAVQVQLKLISGPALDYALVLEGHADAPPEPAEGFPYRMGAVDLRGPLPRWKGRALAEGFGAVEAPATARWEDEIEGLGFGESGRVLVRFQVPAGLGEEQRHDLFLEVPLPAGVVASVAPSAGRDFFSPEIRDGVLIAGIGSTTSTAQIVIEITGTRPGVWTLGAPVLRSAEDPAFVVYGEEATLTVYAPGEAPGGASGRTYRPTPDERLSRGRLAFEDGDMTEALDALMPLYSEWKPQLRPAALSEVARLLLFASLKAEAAGGSSNERSLVDWFEILKERDPNLFVSFDDTLRIAAAYRSIGEPLRSNLLYKAVIDETLGEDLRVASALDGAGEWMRASELAARIWRRYPDSPAADDADLALANRLIERGLDANGEPAMTAAQRSALVLQGISRMRRKVAIGDRRGTVAADAGLALVATYAQAEQWDRAADRAELFGRAFEDPLYRDSFRYSEAVARWSNVGAGDAQGEERRAVEILESIASEPFQSKDGSTRWSPNRDLALYILAQIFHARREPGKAEAYYERVDQAFADARAALQELRAERLKLEEDVVRVRPGEAAKIRFDHKGIERVNVLVYPVDLLTLALRERDLSKVTTVDLAGVTPTLESSIEVKRSVLRPAEAEIEVQLERPGAYLAMLRGGEIHRSALLLATDLELDVVLPGDGSVRVQTMLSSTGGFAEGAAIRILGETSGQVESLKTDRRGVATADGLRGRVTVIARATRPAREGAPPEHHFAFEGSTHPAGPETPSPKPLPAQASNTNYLSNVLEQNDLNRVQRQQRVDEDVQRTRMGVQVQQAK
ncbi:MG2 domain protein [Planctomycetes bacterium Poly30]|uniref:MG2 domain protein n=1 Tax=Saltatorellus ferox TaxID=2528018 RepID=A0A518EWR3_9BACT|nr:MG2 domain protein [Planctomycetes bacterium Poly30]